MDSAREDSSHTSRILDLADGYWDLPPGRIASVVTYLEMHAPPPEMPVSHPTDWSVMRVLAPDPGWYRQLFRAIGQDWLWFSRLRMTDAELAAIIRSPKVEIFAACYQRADAALMEIEWHSETDAELRFFGVLPSLTGMGAGTFLMSFLIEHVFASGARRFHLHTCTFDHPRALSFYVKAGFTAYKRAIELAPDPRLSGDLPRECAPLIPLIG